MAGKISYERGREGEYYAAQYLQRLGYHILDRNFHGGGGELDLVAQKGDILSFVEVKARKAGLGVAAESIAPYKKQRLYRAALAWLAYHCGTENQNMVFLIVLLALDDGGRVIDCALLETEL